MSDLRKAAEMALEALRNAEIVKMEQLNAMYALQEALAQPEQAPTIEYSIGAEIVSEDWINALKQGLIKDIKKNT